jgi:hypothetical protein
VIKGSIEVAQRDRVAGWIYSSSYEVRDKPILAFVGDRCVGAGTVDGFRADLRAANVGDGFSGYDFPISLHEGENLGAVVVKLQDADAALIQPWSRMIGPEDGPDDEGPDLGVLSPASVTWMQDRGWLDQPEYDFLRAMQNIGAYERGLRPPRRANGEVPQASEPATVFADLLSIYMLSEVEIAKLSLHAVSDLAGDASPLRHCAISVIAIWSAERGRVSVADRSHVADRPTRGRVLAAPPPGGIEYSFGPDRLLFLHRDLSFGPQGPAPAGGMTVFTASPRGARRHNGKAAQAGAHARPADRRAPLALERRLWLSGADAPVPGL